jgi:hypothetical protein
MSQFIFGLLAGIVVGLVMEWVIDWAGLFPKRSTGTSRTPTAAQKAGSTQGKQTIAKEAVRAEDSPPSQVDNNGV